MEKPVVTRPRRSTSTPSHLKQAVALEKSAMPAPALRSAGDRSTKCTWWPCRSRPIAKLNPPIPAPLMSTCIRLSACLYD